MQQHPPTVAAELAGPWRAVLRDGSGQVHANAPKTDDDAAFASYEVVVLRGDDDLLDLVGISSHSVLVRWKDDDGDFEDVEDIAARLEQAKAVSDAMNAMYGRGGDGR